MKIHAGKAIGEAASNVDHEATDVADPIESKMGKQ